MFRGTTEETGETPPGHWRVAACDPPPPPLTLTGHLPQAADQQGLVVPVSEGDAVADAALVAVFDLVLALGVGHTQQVLLQQLRAAQHRAVVRKRRHEPADIRNSVLVPEGEELL